MTKRRLRPQISTARRSAAFDANWYHGMSVIIRRFDIEKTCEIPRCGVYQLKPMPTRKIRTGIFVCVAVLLAAGLTTGVVKYEHIARLENVQGAWEGALHFHAGPLLRTQRVVLRIFKAGGAYHAAVDEIDIGMKNLPATRFGVGRSSVNFESDSRFSYQGKLNPEATEITGRWKWAGGRNSQPLGLTRTATPDKVQEPLAEADYAPRPGSDLQGFWTGTLKIGKTALRLHLKIAESPDGTFRGELNSIDQPPIIPLPITTLAYRKPTVTFSLQGVGAMFNGDLNDAGSQIVGTWTQVGTVPLTFDRVNPKDEAQALEAGKNYGYTSNTELQGHWTGTLTGNYGLPLRLVFNLAQLSDGSFAGTMDSPDQSLFASPFDVVAFTPPKVHLEIKSANCVFDGKLLAGKLSGIWSFKDKTSEPLTLEREKPH